MGSCSTKATWTLWVAWTPEEEEDQATGCCGIQAADLAALRRVARQFASGDVDQCHSALLAR